MNRLDSVDTCRSKQVYSYW